MHPPPPLAISRPRRNERVVRLNILLLLALPLAAWAAHLYRSTGMHILIAPSGHPGLALALLLYGCGAAGTLLAWRRLLGRQSVQHRVARGQAALEFAYRTTGRAVGTHPVTALWLAAAAGVLVSCYPVVFGGKSFVSPAISGYALYDHLPTLPGDPDTPPEDPQGSDTESSLVQSIPYAVIERRALLHDGEFPLWNRYNAAAGPLLGQGQSMLGDPLQVGVLLLGANASSWDLKFLLARLLFAAGIGLAVRAATGRVAAALALAFSACFCGFFTFRFNHPAYFSFCYAPWILYAWLEIARDPRRPLRWIGLLLLANWTEFASGAVKESVTMIAGLNATGLLTLALSDSRSTLGSRARALAGLAWAGGCFGLVSAPLWRPLLDTITGSWSDYLHPRAWQLQPGLILGLFDDIFYRQVNHGRVLDPSATFLVLLGVAFAAVSVRTLVRRRTFLAVSFGALVPAALAFGVVPPAWITVVPFLGNIVHIDSTFSGVLIIHLFVLAGFGLERCRDRFRSPEWTVDLAMGAVLVGGLYAAFLGLTQAAPRADFSSLGTPGEVPPSDFFRPYVWSLFAAAAALPWLVRQLWRDRGASLPGLAPWIALCLGALLWRGGQQLHAVAGFDRYVSHPPDRVDLLGCSAAVERVRARQQEEPGRCLGLGDHLVPGFMGVYGLEAPSGPDALQNRYYHALLTDSKLPLIWRWRLAADRQWAVRARRFYDLLNVRFYADAPDSEPLLGTHLLGHDDLDVYESDTVWPRAFFTDALAISRGTGDLFALLAAGDGRPFAAIPPAALTGPDGRSLRALVTGDGGGETRAVIAARDYRLGNHTTSFRVRAPGAGVAALLEAYQDPGNVRVEINGKSAPYFRVNEAFAGVFLPAAGDYEIRVCYGPRNLPWLLGVSALGTAMLAGTAVFVHKKQNADRPLDRSANVNRAAPPTNALAVA